MSNRTRRDPVRRAPRKEVKILARRSTAFADWIDANHLSMAEAAQRLGMSAQHASNLRNGHRTPSLALAARIAEATDGMVPIGSWSGEQG